VVVYTGMGLEGRQPINVRSARAAVFVAGEFGTLAEFSAAWTIGNNILGVLEGIGGITSSIRDIITHVQSEYGNVIFFDTDPEKLVGRVCVELTKRSRKRDSVVDNVGAVQAAADQDRTDELH